MDQALDARYDANGLLIPFDPGTEMTSALKHVESLMTKLRVPAPSDEGIARAVCGHRKGRQ